VGEFSKWNISELLPDVGAHQAAELRAGVEGLKVARAIWESGEMDKINEKDRGLELHKAPTHVVIKTDSEYLVNGMTEWILKWENNGYTNTKGMKVVNRELFEECQRETKLLGERSVIVRFWHVKRKWNKRADDLANAALDEELSAPRSGPRGRALSLVI
jgi:ribonuclease HI